MKELSIEEKAKRYDEAIEIAKEINNEKCAQPFNIMTRVFPELKESEDERIRKEIIAILQYKYENYSKDPKYCNAFKWIAWLEKQGEQPKDVTYTHEVKTGNGNIKALVTEKVQLPEKYEKQGEQKPVDNKLQEFKDKLCELFQQFRWYKDGTPTNGDILEYVEAHIQELLAVANEQKPVEWSEEDINMIDWLIRCCEKEHEELCNDRYGHQEIVSDLKRDCRKKLDWLESLKDKVVPQPKQEWSKEEKKKLDRIYSILGIAADEHAFSTTCRLIGDKEAVELQDFLRSIAKPEQMPEWSDEDKLMRGKTINFIEQAKMYVDAERMPNWWADDCINWLKSIRPQSRWKPSDEQINALAKNVEYVNVSCTQPILKGLLEDLKKLK